MGVFRVSTQKVGGEKPLSVPWNPNFRGSPTQVDRSQLAVVRISSCRAPQSPWAGSTIVPAIASLPPGLTTGLIGRTAMPWRADMKVTERLYGHLMDAGCAVAAEFSPREPGTTAPPLPLAADCSGSKKKLRLRPASQIFAQSCCRSRWRWRQARSSWAPRARSPKTRRFIGSASGPPSSLSLFFSSPNSPPFRRAINQ